MPSINIATQNGYIGVGTTSPSYALDITGTGHFTSFVDSQYFVATSSLIASLFKGGFLSMASSTIGNGAQVGGLTISGGATTTGNAYFAGKVGIGTTTPINALSVIGNESLAGILTIDALTGSADGILNINARNGGAIAPAQIDVNQLGGIALLPNSSGDHTVTIGHTSPINDNTLGVYGKASIGTTYYAVAAPTNGLLVQGNIGLGTTSPLARLDVAGTNNATVPLFQLSSVASFATTTEFIVNNNGSATLAGTLTQNSDQRLRTNILGLDASSSLAAINALNPVTFNWLNPDSGVTPQLGFIAQDVQKVFPTLVSTSSATALTPDGTLGLNYIGLISPIVKAIQALSSEITALEQTVAGFAESFTTKVINSQKDNTQQLCISDGPNDSNPVCITKSQLANLLSGQSSPSVQVSTSNIPVISTSTPPTIQIQGQNPSTIYVGDHYTDLGALVTDNQGHSLGYTAYLNGTLVPTLTIDTSTTTTDTIDYVATDTWGNTATSTRTVIIAPVSQ